MIRGFKENGVAVIECNSRTPGMGKYLGLIKKFLEIRRKNNLDAIFVAFPGQETMFLARFLTLSLWPGLARIPIIFDTFTSHYGGYILDRAKYSKNSLRAKYYRFLDKYSCKLADACLLDTEAHINFFVNEFELPRNKFLRVFVGTDDDIFFPDKKEKNNKKFLAHFHGHFIPLQGAEYIIRAANILKNEDLEFQIIGRGQEYLKIRDLAEKLELKNINWINNIPYEELPGYINRADICLGGFGGTEKAKHVSMNKLFEYMACGKPIITGDSAGVKEFLTDNETAIFCERANAEDLAQKTLILKNDPILRERLGQNARTEFENKYTPQIIVSKLLEKLDE